MTRKVLASSSDISYCNKWCDDVKKGYAKDNLFYRYLDTGDFNMLTYIVFKTEDVFPPSCYFNFMNDPSVETATFLISALLNDKNYNIPIDKKTYVLQNKEIAVKGGGLFDKVDPINMYEHYARIDCLHDVSNTGDNSPQTRYDFAKRIGVTDEVARIYSTMPKKYTKHICQELLENDVKYSLSSTNESKALFSPQVFDVFENNQEVNIVMDGLIWRRTQKHNVQNGFMAAFLLLALEGRNNIKGHKGVYKVKPSKKQGLKKINFIMGDFMDVDGTPLVHFVQKFVERIANLTGAQTEFITCNDKPTTFENMIGKVDLNTEKLTFTPNDGRNALSVRFYPSFDEEGLRNRTRKNKPHVHQPTFSAFEKKLLHSWILPYSKNEFGQMMSVLNEYNDDKATQLLSTFAELNFLRDAWKIDIALQNNALLLTSDMLLYTLIQKMSGNGVCFHIKKYEMENNRKLVFEVDVHCNT